MAPRETRRRKLELTFLLLVVGLLSSILALVRFYRQHPCLTLITLAIFVAALLTYALVEHHLGSEWQFSTETILVIIGIGIIFLILLPVLHYHWGIQTTEAAVELFAYALAIAGFASFVYFHTLFPKLKLLLELRGLPQGIVLVRINVENTSAVVAVKEFAIVQLLDHKSSDVKLISATVPDPNASYGGEHPEAPPTSWVPRDPFDPYARIQDKPIKDQWRKAFDVLDSTITIEPGEVITVDLLYQPHEDADLVHGMLQVKLDVGWLVLKMCRLTLGPKFSGQFTTTAWTHVEPRKASSANSVQTRV